MNEDALLQSAKMASASSSSSDDVALMLLLLFAVDIDIIFMLFSVYHYLWDVINKYTRRIRLFIRDVPS